MSAIDDIAEYLAHLKTGGNRIDQIIFDELPNGEEMNATDELRRLLDERGVEWTEPNNKARSHTTYWTAGFLRCIAVEFNDGMVSIASSSDDITPEQAIDATLGRWTCRDLAETPEYRDKTEFKCSECGYEYSAVGGFGCDCGDAPDFCFCPNCGRKVVDA